MAELKFKPVRHSHKEFLANAATRKGFADAYDARAPLRLVFYSTDGDYHSGKYFWTSDTDAWARPTLEVRWGDAAPPPPTGVRVVP